LFLWIETLETIGCGGGGLQEMPTGSALVLISDRGLRKAACGPTGRLFFLYLRLPKKK
jgi:hypothetical protein